MFYAVMLAGLVVLPAMVVSTTMLPVQPTTPQLPQTTSKPLRSSFSIQDMLSDSDGQAFEAPQGPQASSATSSKSRNQRTGAQRRQGGSQPITFGKAVNPLQALLGGGGVSLAGASSLSVESMDVVSGLIEAFMHKVQLQPGEKSCLKNNVGQITGDVMATGEDIVIAIKALMKTQGRNTSSQEQSEKLLSAGMDSAIKLASLVTLSTQLFKNCVHGDALEMLKRTGRHIINGQYLGHRFIVNGVDIAHGLADAVIAFEAKHFQRFGSDIGTALRKILLSDAMNGTSTLPEGVPEQDIIQKVTEGVMRGFFVQGSGIIITDTVDPRVNIILNLHQCIAGNSAFFKEIWMGLWNLFAQLAQFPQQHGLNPLKSMKQSFSPLFSNARTTAGTSPGTNAQPQWAGELMIALLQFPMALQRCGLGTSTQRMFMEAIKSLKHVHVKVLFPDDRIQALKATDRMARAVEAWTNWDYTTFGKEVGMLLRELVMLAFPRKYSVDNTGRLRRELAGFAEQTPSILVGLRAPSVNPIFTAIVGGCALSMLVGLVAVRSIWSAHREFGDEAPFIDMEDRPLKPMELAG